TLQRLPHLAFVPCSIVDACNAGPVTAHVVEDRLDNVRQDAEFGHHSRGCASEVVEAPPIAVEAAVEVSLVAAPISEPATKYKFALTGLAFKDGLGLIADWNLMLPLILGSRWRQHNQASIKVDLVPSQHADFFAPLCSQDQQADDVPELILA